jgi:formate hydrogenlyase subunit 3/multisubunit Na+/H+ antiporter MnhD subunit
MTVLSGPILLIIVPLFGAAVVWLLGRWPRLAVGAGIVLAWGLALWLWVLPDVEAAMQIFGISLTLTAGIQAMFELVLIGLGVLFLLSMFWPQGRNFVPVSLAVLSPLAMMLLVRPLLLGSLFWLVAAMLLAVVIQAEQAGQTQGAWRYLMLMFFAVILLLAGGWMVETEQAALQELAGQLLAVSFLIMMAGFPFHIWLQPLVNLSAGLILILVLGLGQLMLTTFIFEWLAVYPWLNQLSDFRQMVQWSSGLAALTAAVLAVSAQSMRRLAGSVLLLDMSFGAALLLVPARFGWETAVLLITSRAISLFLIVLGWKNVSDGDLSIVERPCLVLFMGFGLLSLLGLPLTFGFPGRWSVIALITDQADVNLWLPVSLLLAIGGGIIGVWRGVSPMMSFQEVEMYEVRPKRLQIGLGLAIVVGAGFFGGSYVLFAVERLTHLWFSGG